MDQQDRVHKERLLNIYRENLQELEIRAAKFGLHTPLYITHEIKEHRNKIEELHVQIRANAETVTFDQLLIGIEDLQRLIREESAQAIIEYNRAFGDQWLLGFGLFAPLGAGILFTRAIILFYEASIRDAYLADYFHIGSILIGIIGVFFSIYFTFKLGAHISNRRYQRFIKKVGFDPFEKKRK